MTSTDETLEKLKAAYNADTLLRRRSIKGRMRSIYSTLLELRRGGMKSVDIVAVLNEMHFLDNAEGSGISQRLFDVYMNEISQEPGAAVVFPTELAEQVKKTLAPRKTRAPATPSRKAGLGKAVGGEGNETAPEAGKGLTGKEVKTEERKVAKTVVVTQQPRPTVAEIKQGLHSNEFDPADFD